MIRASARIPGEDDDEYGPNSKSERLVRASFDLLATPTDRAGWLLGALEHARGFHNATHCKVERDDRQFEARCFSLMRLALLG